MKSMSRLWVELNLQETRTKILGGLYIKQQCILYQEYLIFSEMMTMQTRKMTNITMEVKVYGKEKPQGKFLPHHSSFLMGQLQVFSEL